MQRRDVTIAVLALSLAAAPAQAAEPKVAASIAPLAGIAAAVLGDAGKPTLLLPPNQSPHHGALRPSQARALAQADVVLWIGPGLEFGLDTALDAMPPEWVAQHALTIGEARGVKTRPFRAFAGISPPEGEAHEGGKEHEHEHEGHDHGDFDPHLWLDPANAAAIANALAERLAIVEPGRAASFRANAERFGASMKALAADLRETLAPVRGKRFVVYHDAYQYFEEPFGLQAVAALTLEPGQPIGGRHLTEVRAKAKETGAVCVFADAQAPAGAVEGIARDLGLKPGILDPLGVKLEPGVDSYAILLKRLAESYAGCLAN